MSTIEFGYLVSSPSGGHVVWGLRRALVMSSSKSRQSLVAVGRTQQLLAPASKPSRCSELPFPSLGICPVSLPVLLPAEGAADQFPPIILTTQPHLGFLLQPPGQDLGERGKEEETPETGLCLLSETVVKIADLCPPVLSSCPGWASGNPWDRVPK